MANETLKYKGSVEPHEAKSLLRSLAEHHLYGVLRLDGSVDCALTFIDGALVLTGDERPGDRVTNQGTLRQLLRSVVYDKGFIGTYAIEPVVDHHNAHARPRFDLLAFLGEGDSNDLAVRTVAIAPESTDVSASVEAIDGKVSESGTASDSISADGPDVSDKSQVSQSGGRRAGDPLERAVPMNPNKPDRPLRASQLRTLLQQPIDASARTNRPPRAKKRATDPPARAQSAESMPPDRPVRPMPQTIGPRVRPSDRSSRGADDAANTEVAGKESTDSGQPNKRRALGRLIRTLAG